MKFSFYRFFARCLDWGLLYIFVVFISLILLSELSDDFYLYLACAIPFMWIPLEALFITYFSTTPGQHLFGIVHKEASGEKLSFSRVFKRTIFWRTQNGQVEFRAIHPVRLAAALLITLICGSALFLGRQMTDIAIHYEKQAVGNWVHYASEDGRFTVNFPKPPKLESHTFPVPHSSTPLELSEYKTKGDSVFSVSYVELPKKWRLFGAGTLLKAAMEVVRSQMPNATLVEKHRVTHKNYPALDFHMKEGKHEVEGRLILVGSTLYKLTVTYLSSQSSQMQHEAFLGSFESKE